MDSNPEASQDRALVTRPVGAGFFALELDGVFVGFLSSVDGGEITGLVVEEADPSGGIAKKHIAGVKFEEMTITANLSLDPVLYNWISDTFNRKFSRKDGRIYTTDQSYKILSEVDFFNALITEVTLPKLDASSKDAAYLTVKFAPEYTRHKKGSGAKLKVPAKGQQKVWHAANFRMTIDGLDCSRVNKVEALTIKQVVTQDPIGEAREPTTHPSKVTVPDLKISLSETSAQSWFDWHENFVIKSDNSDAQEKSGKLTYLSADIKTTLGEVEFLHLGIFRLSRDKVEAGGENIRRIDVEMYVEAMKFTFGGKS